MKVLSYSHGFAKCNQRKPKNMLSILISNDTKTLKEVTFLKRSCSNSQELTLKRVNSSELAFFIEFFDQQIILTDFGMV